MSLKLIYIAGLEHSGTTLLDHLLSQQPHVLGLGEIASFFSPAHMESYMRSWGHLPDAQICSCGESWSACPFWGPVKDLNGLNSNLPLVEKYARLVSYVSAQYKQIEVIIDSSKALATLEFLLTDANSAGLETQDIHVILLVKDVRNFAASVARKAGDSGNSLAHLRSFNWWANVNRRYLAHLRETNVSHHVVSYEHLCFQPIENLNRILERFGLSFDQNFARLEKSSHIAMGNKDFTIRNSSQIRYDDAWMADGAIDIAYALHRRVRRLNQTFHQLSRC